MRQSSQNETEFPKNTRQTSRGIPREFWGTVSNLSDPLIINYYIMTND